MSLKVKFMHECLAHQVVLTPSMKELKLNSEEVKHGNFVRFILFAVKRKKMLREFYLWIGDLVRMEQTFSVEFIKISVKFPHSPILHYAFSSWIEKTMTKTIHRH